MTARRLLPILAGFVLSLAAGLWLLPRFLDPAIAQPVRFNHRIHVEGEGMECTECHETVRTQRFAGLPTIGLCLDCHEEALTESAEEERIRELAAAGLEIGWRRLFEQPRHVYYSHRRHVVLAGLECATCHGDIGAAVEPPSRRPAQLTMDDCLDCHESEGVRVSCTVCHK